MKATLYTLTAVVSVVLAVTNVVVNDALLAAIWAFGGAIWMCTAVDAWADRRMNRHF